jgi:transposase
VNRSPDSRPRARTKPAKQAGKTSITPDDQQLEVRMFLATLSAGESVSEACSRAGLSKRRIARWIAFNDFGSAISKAKRRGEIARKEAFEKAALDASIELALAQEDRTLQQGADEYAGGDRELFHTMWMSGELEEIWGREAIANLRAHGKHDLADRYERNMLQTPRRPHDSVAELMAMIRP